MQPFLSLFPARSPPHCQPAPTDHRATTQNPTQPQLSFSAESIFPLISISQPLRPEGAIAPFSQAQPTPRHATSSAVSTTGGLRLQHLKPRSGQGLSEWGLLRRSYPVKHTVCYIPNDIKPGKFIQKTTPSQLDPAITAVCPEQSFCSYYVAVAAPQQTPFQSTIPPSLTSTLTTPSQSSSLFSGHNHMPQRLLLLQKTSPKLTFTCTALTLFICFVQTVERLRSMIFFSHVCSTNWDHRLRSLGRAWDERKREVNSNMGDSGCGCNFNPAAQTQQAEKLWCIKL